MMLSHTRRLALHTLLAAGALAVAASASAQTTVCLLYTSDAADE